ncbi:TIGR01777 family oxidoreductase [Paenibacillus roseipurpureus]|uniref:TIGR01777 family oxidoreductase n=1 Tax=Paenibacillus roseopurpureus TaxID=2918901 RepID=A0AA96LLB5_9BACL|nr:TIGR01777 family oxidoreductase [Paenibacillus sp. MBLB1832]WNR43227.1 TIGR01777 family oxidoreductase [Paenibacillus sp. MBLB1832]
MKIAITGGSGFIGKRLIAYWLEQGYELINISRSSATRIPGVTTVTWDDLKMKPDTLQGLHAIVNLAGESISQRWTAAAKSRIIQSRLDAAANVAKLVASMDVKPRVVVNASGMSYYGTSETDTFDETSPFRNTDFLASVVKQWEHAADQIQGTRVVKVRVGLVLDNLEGAFPKMALPYKLGVGGTVGSGRQWMSWIHIDDMVRLIDFCVDHDDIEGPVNATAPNPVTNQQFGRTLATVMRRPNIFPVPAFMMKLLFGELSVLLLEGQKVLPRVLQQHGFVWKFPQLQEALAQLMKK